MGIADFLQFFAVFLGMFAICIIPFGYYIDKQQRGLEAALANIIKTKMKNARDEKINIEIYNSLILLSENSFAELKFNRDLIGRIMSNTHLDIKLDILKLEQSKFDRNHFAHTLDIRIFSNESKVQMESFQTLTQGFGDRFSLKKMRIAQGNNVHLKNLADSLEVQLNSQDKKNR